MLAVFSRSPDAKRLCVTASTRFHARSPNPSLSPVTNQSGFTPHAASNRSSRTAGARGGGCAASPRWVRVRAMAAGSGRKRAFDESRRTAAFETEQDSNYLNRVPKSGRWLSLGDSGGDRLYCGDCTDITQTTFAFEMIAVMPRERPNFTKQTVLSNIPCRRCSEARRWSSSSSR